MTGSFFPIGHFNGINHFRLNFFNRNNKHSLHDTWYIFTSFLLIMFLRVIFLVYFIKEFRKKFTQMLSNGIPIITGFVLAITLTFLIKTPSKFDTGGGTLYPLLSALGPDKLPYLVQDRATNAVTNLLTVIRIIILMILLYVVYSWRMQKVKCESNYKEDISEEFTFPAFFK